MNAEPLPALPAPHDRRYYRLAMGLTLQQAGDQIGVSGRTILRWEHGITPNPGNRRRYATLLDGWKTQLHTT